MPAPDLPHALLLAVADALSDDPFYAAVTVDHVAEPARRRATLAEYLRHSMVEGAVLGRCDLADDGCSGAAIWVLPTSGVEAEAEAAADAQRAKLAALASTLGPRGLDAYHRIIAFMGPRAPEVVAPEAWYLSIVGIAPAAQNRGLGARLLAPALADADRAGASCYLETFVERNLAFYRRLGFDTRARHREPTTGADYWILVRPARPTAGA